MSPNEKVHLVVDHRAVLARVVRMAEGSLEYVGGCPPRSTEQFPQACLRNMLVCSHQTKIECWGHWLLYGEEDTWKKKTC